MFSEVRALHKPQGYMIKQTPPLMMDNATKAKNESKKESKENILLDT